MRAGDPRCVCHERHRKPAECGRDEILEIELPWRELTVFSGRHLTRMHGMCRLDRPMNLRCRRHCAVCGQRQRDGKSDTGDCRTETQPALCL
jgi:hypothetical protein